MSDRFPIQVKRRYDPKDGSVSKDVYMAAYAVYAEVFGPQQALIEDGCRGGFSPSELVAFLYASAFPKSEWRMRVKQAFEGMDIE